jgi:glycosyltransferase involved in cell wall biosynthesis
MDQRVKITVLCPVYNEEAAVPLFYQQLKPVLLRLQERYKVDLVFLDNASEDKTCEKILAVRQDWPSTYLIVQSRNVGYQRSLTTGLQRVSGELFVIIDVDCEDPPEVIEEFVGQYEKGNYDVVYGQRTVREESAAISAARKLFYRLLRAVGDEEIILDMAEFALFTNEVREAILADSSTFPFIRASIGRVGFNRYAISYKRRRRITGESHYNIISLTLFAIAGLLASSTFALRLPIYAFPLLVAALLFTGYMYVVHPEPLWATVGALIFSLYVGFVLAFMSLYVARTYKNGLGRPLSFINSRKSILPD